MFTFIEAIDVLEEAGIIDREVAYDLYELRKFQNIVVNEPVRISEDEIAERINKVQEINQSWDKWAIGNR